METNPSTLSGDITKLEFIIQENNQKILDLNQKVNF